MTQDNGQVSNLGTWATKHPALAIGGVSALFTAARLIRISQGSTSTALALLAHVPTSGLLMGTLISVFPLALVVVLVGLGYWNYRTEGRAVPGSLLVGFGFFVLMLTQLGVLVVVAAYGGFSLGFRRYIQWRAGKKGRPPIYPDYSAVAATLIFLILMAPSQPWLPAENLEMADGSARAGWVLSSDNVSLVALMHEDHRIEILDRTSIKRRSLCDLVGNSSIFQKSLTDLVDAGNPGRYPPCS